MPAALEWATAASALSVEREGASSSMPERAEIDARATGGTPVSRRADRPSHG